MRSGRFKDRVDIQSKTVTTDGIGGELVVWVTDMTRNCSIEPVNGREYFQAHGEASESTVRVRFRYQSGILSTDKRLVDNRRSPATIYDIESVIIPGNEDREYIAMCKVRNG